jgi:viroplasmin and RNaseH domain-containing protein
MSDDGNIGDYWRDVKQYRKDNGISSSGNKYYAVAEGKNPGIYSSWESASEQVNGYSNAKHHGFKSAGEAKNYMRDNGKAPQFK